MSLEPETLPEDAGPAPVAGLPMVVVAGRPNVGKSSLVNRIVGERAPWSKRSPASPGTARC